VAPFPAEPITCQLARTFKAPEDWAPLAPNFDAFLIDLEGAGAESAAIVGEGVTTSNASTTFKKKIRHLAMKFTLTPESQ
jgi:hypothetical protein